MAFLHFKAGPVELYVNTSRNQFDIVANSFRPRKLALRLGYRYWQIGHFGKPNYIPDVRKL